jgi:ABC-2 type transport system ATP-binding protein
MRQIIATLRKQGKILLICSHYLPEVEMLRDTVDILHHGKLVQSGAVSDLVHIQNVVEIVLPEGHVASDIVIQPAIAEHVVEMQNNLIRISSKSQDNVLATFSAANVQIHSLNPICKTLEEVYINTT